MKTHGGGIMAIDSISRVVSSTGYQSTAVKPVKEPEQVVNNAQETVAASVAITQSTVVKSNNEQSRGDDKDGQNSEKNGAKSEKKTATMKDISEINKVINQNTIAEFGYNEPTNRVTIKIKDKETDEVIKEIPSEKALEMLAKAWELAGLLVDEKR